MLPNSKAILYNTPGFKSESVYQPGGVASIFHGRIQQRYVTSTKDKYGRWICCIFKGSKHTLRIYTVYRVNPKNGKADISAWAQQKGALQQDSIDTDPRQQVTDSRLCEIQIYINNGDFIIVMSDLNENATSREKTNDKMIQLGLINAMQHRLQTNILPKTHKRGSVAIDHVWISSSLTNAIYKCGNSPFDNIGVSDHRGKYVDIYLSEILDANIYNL